MSCAMLPSVSRSRPARGARSPSRKRSRRLWENSLLSFLGLTGVRSLVGAFMSYKFFAAASTMPHMADKIKNNASGPKL